MSNMNSIAVVSRSPEGVERICNALSGESGVEVSGSVMANGSHDPLKQLNEKPAVLILSLTEFSNLELEELSRTPVDQRPPLIIVGSVTDPNVMRLAMQAGSRDFIPELDCAELTASVRRILRETDVSDSHDKLISFVNAKGGSGGTFLAANYAHINQQIHGYSTLLVDLDRQFVDLPQYLGAKPRASLLDALRVVDELDDIAVNAFVTKNHDIAMIAHKLNEASVEADYEVEFDEERAIRQFMGIAQKKYTHVIAEVPRYLDAMGAEVLRMSDRIMLVMQQNVPSARDALRMVNLLTRDLEIPRDRITVVLNRFDTTAATTFEDVKATLGMADVVKVANDFKSASTAIDIGIPVHAQNPKSAIVSDLSHIIDQLEGHEARQGGLLSRSLTALFRS